MNLIKCYQTNSSWYKGAKRNSTPVGILWHDTAAGNPTLKRYVQPMETDSNYQEMITLLGKNKYGNDWNHIEHEAGLNAWIGQLADGSIATIQAGEWTMTPWGCGAGSKGSCNGYIKTSSGRTYNGQHWVQFEICDDGYKDKQYFERVYKEAVELTAMICKEYNINPKGTVQYNGVTVPTILCHADSYKLQLGGNHGDVYKWFNKMGKTMEDVRNDVAKLLNIQEEPLPVFDKLDIVKIKEGVTKYSNGKTMASWVPSSKLYVREYQGETTVVSTLKEGAITGTCWTRDLVLIERAQTEIKQEPSVKEVFSGSPSTGSEEDQEFIWNFLLTMIENEYAVAGIMGNLYAESAFRSNNLQQTYEKKLGYTDDTYTAAVDDGTYINFVKDSAGYGLAQWTYWSRKEMLLNYATQEKKSIGDFTMQINFLWYELEKNFKSLVKSLKAATSVREASDLMLHKFEQPADQSEVVEIKRAEYSQRYYDKFHVVVEQPKVEVAPEPEPEVVTPEPEVITPEEKNTLMKLIEAVVDFIIGLFKKSK